MLKTGWHKWDKYLQPIADLKRPLKILEVGAYEGAATEWILKNLAIHPDSRVYAIDTWEGSPEYVGVDFRDIEETFWRRVKRSGRERQLVTLKMKSEDGLHHLLDTIGKESIDFAYIDASHEARDVLSDGILVWKLMKENGIVIFDDYIWEDLKQDYFRPQIAIDSFIKCYYPELRRLYTDRQAYIQKKKRSEWIVPLINYKSKEVVDKKISELSKAAMRLPDYVSEDRSTRRTTRKSGRTIETELALTKIPSYTDADKMSYDINKYVPPFDGTYHGAVILFKTVIPNMDIQTHAHGKFITKELFFKYVGISNLHIGNTHRDNSTVTSILEFGVGSKYIQTVTSSIFENIIEYYKYFFPNLKNTVHLYIKEEDDTKSYAHMPWLAVETINSILSGKFISLKEDTYDFISIPTIMDHAFNYRDYTALNYKGRDSYCIKWISFYLLAATHCLRKKGTITFDIFGDQSPIVCEFISFVSTFFSKTPILKNRAGGMDVNGVSIFFNGYKGITSDQRDQLQKWYTTLTPGYYYTHLGVPCKEKIKTMVHDFSLYLNKKLKRVLEISKQLRELLDNVTPPTKEYILKEYSAERISNYFTVVSEYIKEIQRLAYR